MLRAGCCGSLGQGRLCGEREGRAAGLKRDGQPGGWHGDGSLATDLWRRTCDGRGRPRRWMQTSIGCSCIRRSIRCPTLSAAAGCCWLASSWPPARSAPRWASCCRRAVSMPKPPLPPWLAITMGRLWNRWPTSGSVTDSQAMALLSSGGIESVGSNRWHPAGRSEAANRGQPGPLREGRSRPAAPLRPAGGA